MPSPARARAQEAGPAQQTILLGRHAFTACSSGALYWANERLLIVADLHMEKGSAFASRGQLLPPYDTRETLSRLADTMTLHRPRTVIALGDSFHDAGSWARLSAADARTIADLQRGRRWIWVRGNHDPQPAIGLQGDVQDVVEIDGIVLRHEPSSDTTCPEIAGHLHPAARLVWNGTSVRARCFAASADRLVLPAFGAYTGSLNVLSEPFATLFGVRPAMVIMLGRTGLYSVPPASLVGD